MFAETKAGRPIEGPDRDVSTPGAAFQNKLPPQCEQKPRWTLSDDWYQFKVSEGGSLRSADLQLAMTAKLPLVRAHGVQWQATG